MMKTLQFVFTFLLCFSTTFAQSTASLQVSTFEINSPELDTIKKIWIYLPKSYDSTRTSFPVLYLQDAQNLFDKETSYVGEWQVDETLDSLHLDLIVVGIEHGGSKRIDELTPYSNEKYGGGNADSYLKFLTETVKPQIDKKYRTLPDAKNTFIGGSSLGGLFAYYSALKCPDIFSKAVVFSPSFWYSEDIKTFTENLDATAIKDVQIYFRAGEQEDETMVSLMTEMEEQLVLKTNLPDNYNIDSIPEGKHNEKLWREEFPEAAKWLLSN